MVGLLLAQRAGIIKLLAGTIKLLGAFLSQCEKIIVRLGRENGTGDQ